MGEDQEIEAQDPLPEAIPAEEPPLPPVDPEPNEEPDLVLDTPQQLPSQDIHPVSSIEVSDGSVKEDYPSLYDTEAGTIVAILFGISIVAGVQIMVHRIYAKARSEQEILTRFAISVVALVIGVYITDLLIAGPDTSLLDDEEHTIILSFVKDICLMVFSYYFGTKSASPPPDYRSETPSGE